MRKKIVILFLLVFAHNTFGQVTDWEKYADSLRTSVLEDGDIEKEYILPEMHINFSKEELERIQIESVLKRRLLRVYPRSEERRVGKECRSGGWRHNEKK